MRIDLFPKKGLMIHGKLIKLGSHINDAIEILGTDHNYENAYYFLDGTLAFFTNSKGEIQEIEVRNGEDYPLLVMFEKLNLFHEEKEVILDYFTNLNGEPLSMEYGIFISDKLGISFSFGMSDEEIEELIYESKADGVYEEMKEEIEQDIYRSKHLETFLIRL